MTIRRTRRRPTILVAVAASALVLSACSAGSLGSSGSEGTQLSFLVDNSEATVALGEALAKDFNASQQGITVKVETRPAGSEGDNLIKTRLATGDMTDVFMYNSGSLFQALTPEKQLAKLTGESWVGSLDKDFRESVSAGGDVYGLPFGSSSAGGILYNRDVYARLGLQVPTTWDQFMANNAAIKAAGVDPVIQTYQTTWTSQLFVLADFHNVAKAEPNFATDYTAGKVKYATSPAALRGFQHLQEVHDAGFMNADFASAKQEDGLRMLATGKGAHYPMLTGAVADMLQSNPEAASKVGFFAQPGADTATNGATYWLASGTYIPATLQGAKLDAAKKFLAWMAGPAGCETTKKANPATGPYHIKGCELPADVPQSIKDLDGYFEKGAITPALEFLSPVKGPALEQITVEVGSGIRPAKDGAALYDEDVKKQALQLGLPGWD